MAGLGELSRIGELVLNPFLGPRSKSIVFTTDLPLQPDRPIDFGLQLGYQLFIGRDLRLQRVQPATLFDQLLSWNSDRNHDDGDQTRQDERPTGQ